MEKKTVFVLGLFAIALVAFVAVAGSASAQAVSAEQLKQEVEKNKAAATGFIAIGAGLALGIAGLGTGVAQQGVGAAAVGAIAEDPKFFGRGILLMVIPESILLFGFAIAFLLMQQIPA
jgi:V/A-type H+-transporting ATPase subunit K